MGNRTPVFQVPIHPKKLLAYSELVGAASGSIKPRGDVNISPRESFDESMNESQSNVEI